MHSPNWFFTVFPENSVALTVLAISLVAAWIAKRTDRSAPFAALLALTDLFGAAARMMPYYSGLAPWNHGSITQFPLAVARLHVPVWLAIAWIAATVAIPLLMPRRKPAR